MCEPLRGKKYNAQHTSQPEVDGFPIFFQKDVKSAVEGLKAEISLTHTSDKAKYYYKMINKWFEDVI